MIQFSPKEGIDMLAVEVPEDATDGAEIRGAYSKRDYAILSWYGCADAIILPPGQWSIVGRSDEVGDDWFPFRKEDVSLGCISYNESIQANGGSPDKKYLILKKETKQS